MYISRYHHDSMFSNFLRILGNCSYYCEWLNSVISDFKACDHCLLTGNMKLSKNSAFLYLLGLWLNWFFYIVVNEDIKEDRRKRGRRLNLALRSGWSSLKFWCFLEIFESHEMQLMHISKTRVFSQSSEL